MHRLRFETRSKQASLGQRTMNANFDVISEAITPYVSLSLTALAAVILLSTTKAVGQVGTGAPHALFFSPGTRD
jgi:hypothetical protein